MPSTINTNVTQLKGVRTGAADWGSGCKDVASRSRCKAIPPWPMPMAHTPYPKPEPGPRRFIFVLSEREQLIARLKPGIKAQVHTKHATKKA